MKKYRLVFVLLAVLIGAHAALAVTLANDGKRGLYMSSIEGVLRLPDEEIDLATAALLLSREWGANKTPTMYRSKIDDMAEDILARMKEKRISADYRAIEIINEYLFKDLGFASLETADNPDDLFLHVVLERKRGYCLSLSVLYLAIAERIGLPAYGVVVPGHFFVRYDDGKKQYNIETTSGGAIATDKHYIEKFPPPSSRDSLYLKNLTPKQTLGCFFNNLGNSYADRALLDYAFDYLVKAVQINPSLAEAHTNLGNVLLRLKRPDEAIAQYEQALSILGPDATNYNNMGNAYLQLGQYDRAKGLYLKALKLKKDFVDVYRNLAQAYQGLGEFDKAVAQMQAAVILKPADAQNFLYLAQLYRKMGRIAQAQTAFSKALDIDPQLASAYTGLGNLSLDQKDFTGAANLFQQSLSIRQDDAEAWFGLALAMHYLERTNDEIEAYRQVLRIDSTQSAALQNMGNAYLKLQQADLAAQCYTQALQIDPQNSDLYHNLAVAYANQKEYNKAIDSYRAALSLSPDNGALHNGLAICYYLNGDKTSARKHALAAQKAGITVQQELLQGK